MSVFRSFLRKLLKDLKEIDKSMPDIDENKQAKELMKLLIEETKKDIEDN